MTNAEKYRLSGIEAYNLSQELGEYLTIEKKAEGVFVSDINSFFVKATKPTLTEDERVILRNICYTPLKDFYIERRHGTLKLHNRVDELYDFFAYDHLFQFIKERRRI